MSATRTETHPGSYLMPALEHATVADAMHPGVMSCQADTPLTEVARIMATQHVHCVAVMGIAHDGSGEALVWGIISDLDLLRAGLTDGPGQNAAELARRPIISVNPDTPLRHAAEAMLAHEARHLVVVDPEGQRPVGVLSTLDLAGILAWGEA